MEKVKQIIFDKNFTVIKKTSSESEPGCNYVYRAEILYDSNESQIDQIVIKTKNNTHHVVEVVIEVEEIANHPVSELKKYQKKELIDNFKKDNFTENDVKKLFLYSVLIEASKVSIKKNHLESSLKSSTA
jgi:hypothetical protein